MLPQTLASIQRWAGDALRGAVVGEQHPQPDDLASTDDPGLFGPDSVAWQVHGDASMFIGGLRALLLQTLHPSTMAGVADHSDYRNAPWARLQRTGQFIATTTYGSTATAEQVITKVAAIHRHIVGTTPEGVPYEANDPHLLEWVHITEVDSFLRAYQRYGNRQLTGVECDRYIAEMTAAGYRLGAKNLPHNRLALDARLKEYRPECHYGAQARDAVRFLLMPPVPLALRGAYGVVTTASVTLLPRWARRKMWIWVPPGVDTVAVRPAATALTRTLGWLIQASEADRAS